VWQHLRGSYIPIVVARYLAAHSPTERAAPQTAEIARRLMCGGELHREATAFQSGSASGPFDGTERATFAQSAAVWFQRARLPIVSLIRCTGRQVRRFKHEIPAFAACMSKHAIAPIKAEWENIRRKVSATCSEGRPR
jgi:hypothetical protein